MRLGADSQFSDFLDGLGPAQLVGRQTLATPAMGKNNYFHSRKLMFQGWQDHLKWHNSNTNEKQHFGSGVTGFK